MSFDRYLHDAIDYIHKNHCLQCKFGKAVVALDGDRENTDPENWILIPRAMLPLMNGFRGPNYQTAEPEVRPVIMALTKLRYARSVRTR